MATNQVIATSLENDLKILNFHPVFGAAASIYTLWNLGTNCERVLVSSSLPRFGNLDGNFFLIKFTSAPFAVYLPKVDSKKALRHGSFTRKIYSGSSICDAKTMILSFGVVFLSNTAQVAQHICLPDMSCKYAAFSVSSNVVQATFCFINVPEILGEFVFNPEFQTTFIFCRLRPRNISISTRYLK